MDTSQLWMQTYTGQAFCFNEGGKNSGVSLNDIARPLSRIPRFGGHTTKPLTVAEHCIAVADILKAQGFSSAIQLHGLLHDAHEAFTGDLVAPFKRYLKEVYHIDMNALQGEIQTNIIKSLGIDQLMDFSAWEAIHSADLMACKIERDLYMRGERPWPVIDDIKYLPEFRDFYPCMSPYESMSKFIRTYYDLFSAC